jgi:hypothetical protein
MSTEENDGRLSFDAALAHVLKTRQAAFVAVPVFGDNDEAAEGARIFLLESDGAQGVNLRFIAGPFFSNAYAANETLPAAEAPDSVRELRFMPTRCEEAWLDEQIQTLIQKLVKAAGIEAAQMPDYESAPQHGAGPEAVFPVSFIGRGESKPH